MYKRYLQDLEMSSKKGGKMLKVVVFLGTVRENRLGLRVAKFIDQQLKSRNFQVSLFDPLEMEFSMLTKPIFFYDKERTGAPTWMVEAEKKIKDADAYVLVSGEYNHSVPPALTNMLDHFGGSAYSWKPSGLVTYSAGMFGGMRSAMQLRALTGELGCLSVSNIFAIPRVKNALDEEGNPTDSHMVTGAEKLLNQLEWMAWAMKNHREKEGIPS